MIQKDFFILFYDWMLRDILHSTLDRSLVISRNKACK